MAATFLFALGIIQLGVGVIKPSIDNATQSQSIKDNIQEINKQSDDLKKQFEQLNSDISKFNQELSDQITNNINTISKLHAQIYLAQNEINSGQKKIQMYGIIFICFIFFALLVKQFNIFSDIKIF